MGSATKPEFNPQDTRGGWRAGFPMLSPDFHMWWAQVHAHNKVNKSVIKIKNKIKIMQKQGAFLVLKSLLKQTASVTLHADELSSRHYLFFS